MEIKQTTKYIAAWIEHCIKHIQLALFRQDITYSIILHYTYLVATGTTGKAPDYLHACTSVKTMVLAGKLQQLAKEFLN